MRADSPSNQDSSNQNSNETARRGKPLESGGLRILRYARAITWRTVQFVFVVCFSYLAFCLLGMWPVNRDFKNATDGVEVFVSSNGVHADLILPVQNSVVDWRKMFPAEDFRDDYPHRSHVAIGWGDRGFHLTTPTWSDFKMSTATHAFLLPSDTVIHVQCMRRPRTDDSCKRIVLSKEQYDRLVRYIKNSLANGEPQLIDGYHYNHLDAFYDSSGNYHAFNTCNSWAGRGLKQSGVCTGQWTPLPATVLYYLPE
jgi:uncharacterized protein (TIGR02117 family)